MSWSRTDCSENQFKKVNSIHRRAVKLLHSVYYALFYTENFLMLALWAGMTSDRDAWFYIPAIVTVIVLFLLHIVTQLLYYKCFHPKAGDIEWLDFVLGIVGIILYIVDIATDLQLAISYFLGGHMIYGAMTTAFIGLAYIVVSGFGMYVFLENKKVPTAWWVCRIVFLILGLSPVILTVETMCYGMKSRARRKDGEREEEEDKRYTDHAEWTVVVRLFEGFLEAAPQLCFQLYITFKEKPDDDVGADRDAWFYIPAIVTVIVLFLLHIITQLFYYKWVHPKAGDIEWCMKCDRETVLQSLKNVDF
nr:hypothetical protein BaRGS_005927 [Batillaria attramentaria]